MSFGEYLGAGSNTTKLLLHLNGNSNDSSGNGLNGADNNIVYSKVYGRYNEGANFNGSSSFITCGNSVLLKAPVFRCSCWVKINSLSYAYNSVICNEDNSRGYTLLIKSTGKLAVYISAPGLIVRYDGTGIHTLSPNIWYKLCFTYSGTTGIINCWVNGRLDATASGTNNEFFNNSESFYVGKSYFANRFFNGNIDEVIFENRTWTTDLEQKEYTYQKGWF